MSKRVYIVASNLSFSTQNEVKRVEYRLPEGYQKYNLVFLAKSLGTNNLFSFQFSHSDRAEALMHRNKISMNYVNILFPIPAVSMQAQQLKLLSNNVFRKEIVATSESLIKGVVQNHEASNTLLDIYLECS